MKCNERGVVINFSSVTEKIDPSTGAMRPLTSAKQMQFIGIFSTDFVSQAGITSFGSAPVGSLSAVLSFLFQSHKHEKLAVMVPTG